MYITPNTVVRLLTGVPLDTTYAHTIYFANKSAQTQYFVSKTKSGCMFGNQSYQRHTKGSIRLQKSADDIYDCNYMMFQNTSFGDKWFYAFITSIEYVSNVVCEIEYEIDDMQTWFFDVKLLDSFVEREHSATDVAGDNIVPEPVNIGEYYTGTKHNTDFFDVFDVVVVSPYKMDDSNPGIWYSNYECQTVDKNPTMLTHMAISTYLTSAPVNPFEESFRALSEQVGIESDNVVDAYLMPRKFLNVNQQGHYNCAQIDDNFTAKNFLFSQNAPTALCHGYVPKNKKLLTYPYNKLVCDTADGNLHDYCFEFFNDPLGKIAFEVYCYRGSNLSFKACPINYKGQTVNMIESCLLTDFPPFPYIIDSYRAWIAQNKTRLALQVGADIAGIGTGLGSVLAGSQIHTPITNVLSTKGARLMAEGYDQMGKSGVRGVGGTLAELADRRVNRFKPSGSSSGSVEMSMGYKDFNFYQYSVTPQNAKVIDDFFNVYGYATHLVKIPNRNVRPHWTYVKTIDINVEGDAPADAVNHICSIYDSGITFWRNPSEVGNYSLDNSPS